MPEYIIHFKRRPYIEDVEQEKINEWLKVRGARSKSTYKTYLSAIRKWQELSPVGIKDLKAGDIVDYMNALKEEGYSERGIATYIKALKSLLTFAYRSRYIEWNPADLISVSAPVNITAQHVIPESVIAQMIEAAPNDDVKLVIWLLYETGCRISEAVNIWQEDITRTGEHEATVRIVGKGKRLRYVTVTGWLADRMMEGPYTGGRLINIQVRKIQLYFNQISEAIGHPGITPHWMRHSRATHLIYRGVNIGEVRDLLGHETISTTNQYIGRVQAHALPTSNLREIISGGE